MAQEWKVQIMIVNQIKAEEPPCLAVAAYALLSSQASLWSHIYNTWENHSARLIQAPESCQAEIMNKDKNMLRALSLFVRISEKSGGLNSSLPPVAWS